MLCLASQVGKKADFRQDGVSAVSDVADKPSNERTKNWLLHLTTWKTLVTLRYSGAIKNLIRRITGEE